MYECEWFQVYNLMEDFHAHLGRSIREPEAAAVAASACSEVMNDVFVEQGVGWHLVNGQIVIRGSEAFQAVVKETYFCYGNVAATDGGDTPP